MNRTVKLSLFCAGIFACGVVAGGLGMRKSMEPPEASNTERAGGPQDGFGPQQLRRLSAELDLTEAQSADLLPILEKAGVELRQLRRESFRQSGLIFEAMESAAAELLTPAQREKLTVLQEEQRARVRAKFEERNRRRAEDESRRQGEGAVPVPDSIPPPPGPAPDAP